MRKIADAVAANPQMLTNLAQPDMQAKSAARGLDLSFVLPTSPYHGEFLLHVDAARARLGTDAMGAAVPPPPPPPPPVAAQPDASVISPAVAPSGTALAGAAAAPIVIIHQPREEAALVDPYPADYSVPVMAQGIPAVELDMMKLAAQHAAVQGPAFVTALLARSAGVGGRYNFAHPDHPRHPIFAALQRAYRLVFERAGELERTLEALAGETDPTDAAASSSDDEGNVAPVADAAAAAAAASVNGRGVVPIAPSGAAGSAVTAGGASLNARERRQRARAVEAARAQAEKLRLYLESAERTRHAQKLTEAELRARLNWEDFTVLHTFSLAELQITV
jgi:hypothetical protein